MASPGDPSGHCYTVLGAQGQAQLRRIQPALMTGEILVAI